MRARFTCRSTGVAGSIAQRDWRRDEHSLVEKFFVSGWRRWRSGSSLDFAGVYVSFTGGGVQHAQVYAARRLGAPPPETLRRAACPMKHSTAGRNRASKTRECLRGVGAV